LRIPETPIYCQCSNVLLFAGNEKRNMKYYTEQGTSGGGQFKRARGPGRARAGCLRRAGLRPPPLLHGDLPYNPPPARARRRRAARRGRVGPRPNRHDGGQTGSWRRGHRQRPRWGLGRRMGKSLPGAGRRCPAWHTGRWVTYSARYHEKKSE